MSALDAVHAVEEGLMTEEEAMEMAGCVSLVELYEAAAEAIEQRDRDRSFGIVGTII